MSKSLSTETVERNIGFNKGRPRLWLEKDILSNNGFKVGDKFTVTVEQAGRMRLDVNPEGKRKVSGKGDRPIIDLTGKTLEEAGLAGGMVVRITSTKAGSLTVAKAHK